MVGRKSNMRRSPQTDVSVPITYTPTTHRISKAKKGKRVHACEFPGCTKRRKQVFTRAEHRRRHELNHNPEASYRCNQAGCKKAFHRPDLLARHMERHELESQPEQTQWSAHSQAPVVTDSSSIPRCMAVDNGSLLAGSSHHSQPMSIGSLVAPGVHPELANDCSLVWNGMDLPLQQQRPPTHMFQGPVPESADDSPFYSSPAETCPSPLSDATFSLPPHSSSSISSASVSVIDQYPKGLFKTETASPPANGLPAALGWLRAGRYVFDRNYKPSHPVQCHYPSPSWSSADCMPYEDQVHSMAHMNQMGWKQWAL
ncbi:hypothetical protein N7492_005508 [Penicillium capsulatum]|uniref:C2H2-type domain-containing protein n=1 Tax=Penicillium capsulatum TaxID=69766 RepID=A0A9W9LRY8_9EURO|nr:hypothetical protein N7492_005508 [Penicillium capsulatum]